MFSDIRKCREKWDFTGGMIERREIALFPHIYLSGPHSHPNTHRNYWNFPKTGFLSHFLLDDLVNSLTV